MKTFLVIIQILLSLLLTVLIFLQATGESESRSNIMSTSGLQKRGWEKAMFYFTLIILSLFLVSSIIQTSLN